MWKNNLYEEKHEGYNSHKEEAIKRGGISEEFGDHTG